jgi:asparagine synthase (glutamine-hydrolysing)
MCGITGWVSFDRDLRGAAETLDAMTETMSCRGPDDRGTWTHGPAGLGHRRLAIIDLPGGRQPMTLETPRGTLALVYSGETYNFTELREELTGRGHRFVTDSDTEVVLHGYLEWGTAVAERLNGMYAFAVWDGRDDKLVMVRDRMGIKPFYYYPTPDGVLFGSEPKAILANPLACSRVTLDGLRELFAFVKTPGHAVWDGMHEVEPGTASTSGRGRGLRRALPPEGHRGRPSGESGTAGGGHPPLRSVHRRLRLPPAGHLAGRRRRGPRRLLPSRLGRGRRPFQQRRETRRLTRPGPPGLRHLHR